LTREQKENNAALLKGAKPMIRALAEEVMALTSLTLLLASVAVWMQVLGAI
jgi:hypothetical protein